MAKLRLTVACGAYDIVKPLIEGTVEADGLDLTFLTDMGPRERHWRMGRKHEFDVCEENVGAYYMIRDQGEPLTAIPVFLHRRFRHGFVFINTAAGIREPKDLAGKTIGGTNFQPASNIWMRGILEEHYGVPHRSITWLVDRSEDVAFEPPPGLRIEMKTSSKTLPQMLADGDIPAMISPTLPKPFVEGDKRIARLFADYKNVEIAFFGATGIFPIMHVTTLKQEIADKYPWVATNLTKAFEAAKQLAYRRIANPRMAPLVFVRTAVEEQERIFGKDPWSYGLTPANRKNLETVQRYTHQQGMIRKDHAARRAVRRHRPRRRRQRGCAGGVLSGSSQRLGFVSPKCPSKTSRVRSAKTHRSSWPGLSRPSTPCFVHSKAWMPGTRPGMTVERQVRKLRHRHSFSRISLRAFSMHMLLTRADIVAARRIPADCRAKLSVSNPSPLQSEGSGAPIRSLDLPQSPKASQNLIFYLAFQP